jgi:isoquinoline 1-oxidoreductase alpha subunit
MVSFTLNGEIIELDVADDMPLLWAIRDKAGLTGTKYGCGIAQCGACTVHVDGAAIRSCVLPVRSVAGKSVTTIESLAAGDTLHPVQQAWIDEQVPQCGYCQSGMIMAAAALLKDNPNPDDATIDKVMTNICRCGTYPRIRKAIHRAAATLGSTRQYSEKYFERKTNESNTVQPAGISGTGFGCMRRGAVKRCSGAGCNKRCGSCG